MFNSITEDSAPDNLIHFPGSASNAFEYKPMPQDLYPHLPDDKQVEMANRLYAAGGSLALVGPSGTRKTTFAKALAELYGQRSEQIQGHDQLEHEDMVGRMVHTGDPEKPTAFRLQKFSVGVRDGHTVILDEFAMVPQGTLGFLNEVANGGDLTIERGEEPLTLKRSGQFRMIVTFNPWLDYSGNHALNLATVDRLHLFIWDFDVVTKENVAYHPEMRILRAAYPKIRPYTIEQLLHFAESVRAIGRKHRETSTCTVTTRTLIHMCQRMTLGETPTQAINGTVLAMADVMAPEEKVEIAKLRDNLLDVAVQN